MAQCVCMQGRVLGVWAGGGPRLPKVAPAAGVVWQGGQLITCAQLEACPRGHPCPTSGKCSGLAASSVAGSSLWAAFVLEPQLPRQELKTAMPG